MHPLDACATLLAFCRTFCTVVRGRTALVPFSYPPPPVPARLPAGPCTRFELRQFGAQALKFVFHRFHFRFALSECRALSSSPSTIQS